MGNLAAVFDELRNVQQYGLTLRREGDTPDTIRYRSFSDSEIEYGQGLVSALTLSRYQVTTLLRTETEDFNTMVSTLNTAVENALTTSIREGQVMESVPFLLLPVPDIGPCIYSFVIITVDVILYGHTRVIKGAELDPVFRKKLFQKQRDICGHALVIGIADNKYGKLFAVRSVHKPALTFSAFCAHAVLFDLAAARLSAYVHLP